MNRALKIALFAMLVAGPLSVADAGYPPAIAVARKGAETQVQEWKSERQNLLRYESESEELAHRIAALKRLGKKRTLANTRALESLLLASVEAQAKLEESSKKERQLKLQSERAVREAIKLVDAEVMRQKPDLRSRSQETRASVARSLKTLIQIRDELKLRLAELAETDKDSHGSGQASHEVAIDALDGPEELREKADFLDDARDRYQKKQSELLALLKDAKQDREIAKAAASFQTSAAHFDEDARMQRVRRQGGNELLAAAPNARANNDASDAREGNGVFSPAPGANDSFAGDGDSIPSPTAPTQPPPTGISGSSASDRNLQWFGQTPKQQDVHALLRLRLEAAARGELDVATLEKTIQELAELNARLEKQAEAIRGRAKRLEEDEAKALGQ